MTEHAIHILLVEDNPGDARLLQETLRDADGFAFDLIHVERLDEALARLATMAFDVLLLDLHLPDGTGTDAVARLTAVAPHLPVVVLTGTDDQALGVEAVRCGAQDYLVKGQTDHRLLTRAMRYAIERKLAAAALRQAHEQLRLFAEHAPAAIAMFDTQMRYLAASQRWLTDFGLGGQDLHGRSHYEVFPDVPERWKEIHRRCLAGGVARADEDAFLRADGSTQWLRWEIRPWHNAAGATGGIVIFSEDITARKLAEEKLRDLSQRLSYHMDNSPLAVIEWGADMRLTRWSGEAERIFGWQAHEVLGKRMEDFRWVYPEDAAHVAEVSAQLQSGTNPRRFSANRNYRKDGAVVHCEWYNSALLDESGKLRSILSLVLDVTERQRMDEMLSAAKRSAEQAREAAEAASRTKDDFLAVLSHELRTPLTPVLTAVQMMEAEHTLPAAERDSLALIRRNVELEIRLIDDLLDLTRISRGKLTLHMLPVDLHELQQHVQQICASEIQSKRLQVTLQLAARQCHVRGDAARLQQILWNLLKNAVKFTPEGGTITIRSANPVPQRVTITVTDTGMGIKPALLPRIFNAFEQGEFARQFGGLGLGLAISRQIAELHGGTLTVHSAGKDKGATFTLEFDTCAAEKVPVAPPQLFATGGTRKTGGRILLVEDHADTSRMMSRLLRGFGYQLRIADSVATALRYAAAEHFDALVSDIGLPDGSGLDLMRQLRAHHPIKGIALSGYGMEEDVRRSLEAGFCAHLIKPVDMRNLEEVLRELCG